MGDGSHPSAFPDVVGVVVRTRQGDELAGSELDQPVGILGLPNASDEGDLFTQVAADRGVRPLQLRHLARSLSEKPLAIVEAGELQIGLVCVALAVRRRLLGELLLHGSKRCVALGQEPRALADRCRAAAGIAVGDVDSTLLDQVHDSAQVAADHLQSLDAERLLARDLQGVVDVGDQPVCPVEEVDGRAPRQKWLEAMGRVRTGVLRVAQPVPLAIAAVQVWLWAQRCEQSQNECRRRDSRSAGAAAVTGAVPAGKPRSRRGLRAQGHLRPDRERLLAVARTVDPRRFAGDLAAALDGDEEIRRLRGRRRRWWSAGQVDGPAVRVPGRVGVPGTVFVRRRNEKRVQALAQAGVRLRRAAGASLCPVERAGELRRLVCDPTERRAGRRRGAGWRARDPHRQSSTRQRPGRPPYREQHNRRRDDPQPRSSPCHLNYPAST